MERPSKRPRNESSPLNRDEVDNDELTLRPEEVNAIRDPGYQLQNSRAVAAFKLKSAFERIFEKYEKDFTGVGDEIDLRTGKVVVDNGHLQSLKDSTWLANGDDGDDDDDNTVDEEERILQGKTDSRLSLMQHKPMPLTIQPRPPFFQDQWSSPSPFMSAPPMLSSISLPNRSFFGSYQMQKPMHYGAPQLGQALESAWVSPDLPPPQFRGVLGPVPLSVARRAKARVPVITTGEPGDDNEDDLLLGVSTGPSKAIDNVTGAPELSSPNHPNVTEMGIDNIQDTKNTALGVQLAKYKIPEMKKFGPRKKRMSRKSMAERNTPEAAKNLPANAPVPSSELLPATSSESMTTKASSVVPFQGQSKTSSFPGPRTTTNPSIRTIRVEIPPMKESDRSSFKIVSLEASPELQALNYAEEPAVEAQPSPRTQEALVELSPEHQQPRVEEAEIFTRNAIDPSYIFSDEDEPTLPRRPESQSYQKFSPTQDVVAFKATKTTPKPVKPKRVAKKIRESLASLAPAEVLPSRTLPSPDTSSNPASEAHEDAVHSEETPSLLRLRPKKDIRADAAEDSVASDIPAVSLTVESLSIDTDPGTVHNRLFSRKRKAKQFTPPKDAQVIEPPVQDPLCRTPDPPSPALDPSVRVIPETPEASPSRPSIKSPILESPPSPELGIFSEVISDLQEQDKDPHQSQNRDQAQQLESESLPNVEARSSPPKRLNLANELKSAPPKTPSSKTLGRFTRPNPSCSSAKTGILSLVSDDEDELSLGPSDFTPSGSRRRNTSLLPDTDTVTGSTSHDRVRSFLQTGSTSAPSSARRATTLTRRGVVVGGGSSFSHGKPSQFKTPPSRGKTRGRFGALLLSRLSAKELPISTLAIRGGNSGSPRAVSPVSRVGSELIRTPGGSKRRCGEGDFRCDRDFCFVCLR